MVWGLIVAVDNWVTSVGDSGNPLCDSWSDSAGPECVGDGGGRGSGLFLVVRVLGSAGVTGRRGREGVDGREVVPGLLIFLSG